MKVMANSEPRRLSANNQTFWRADIGVGDSVTLFNQIGRKNGSGRRGPAAIPDVDGTGATAKFQGQSAKVDRCGVHKRQKLTEVGGVCGLDVDRFPCAVL